MKEQLMYFGTSTTDHGHYIWTVGESALNGPSLDLDLYPFSPYDVKLRPATIERQGLNKGDVVYKFIDGYSVLRIEGSCYDKRGGTVSVFWVNYFASKERMKEIILGNPVSADIINKMPFEVNW